MTAFYNEVANLRMALALILKLSVTTGAIFAIPLVYGASKLGRALRVPAHDLLPNLVNIAEAKKRRAA